MPFGKGKKVIHVRISLPLNFNQTVDSFCLKWFVEHKSAVLIYRVNEVNVLQNTHYKKTACVCVFLSLEQTV